MDPIYQPKLLELDEEPLAASAKSVAARPATRASTSIVWSYSRRSVFEQCLRRYYYTYYGAAVRTAKSDTDNPELRRLKALTNRFERSGELLHLGIARYLRAAQENTPMNAVRLTEWLRSVLRRDIEYSSRDPEGLHVPEGKYPPKLLREYHYHQQDAKHLLAEAEDRLADAVYVFATHPALEPFRLAGSASNALIEHHLRLPTLALRIDGRLDLAYRDGGRVTVVDWKLGAADGGGEESLQLAVYALWAVDHFSVTSDHVRICKAHLTGPDVADFAVSDRTLALARIRILQDVERMQAMERYGHDGVVEAFTASAYPKVCALCPFQRICPEGGKYLHD